MVSLNFQTTRSVICDPGASAQLGDVLQGLNCRRVFIVTDPGIEKLGLMASAKAALAAADIAATVFTDVVADPPEAVVHAAVDAARAFGADGVVGFGGGSSMDVAKLVAFLMCSEQSLSDIYGIGQCRGPRLPLVQVPTTAGTGSEVTPISIITQDGAAKMGVVSPQLLPDCALLDADLTLGLPQAVTAATGIDAMVHAIEAYTSKVKKNLLSDSLARDALRLLGGNIRRVCTVPDDRQARSNMLLGSMLAGMAFANAPVAAVHALAYPIGGHFHVPHGLSNSLVMPHVMRFNSPAAAPLYAELAPIIFPDIGAGDDQAVSTALIARIEALIADLGIENRLTQVGINHNQVPMLAADAMKQTRLLVNNPRDVSYDDAVAIYEAAL